MNDENDGGFRWRSVLSFVGPFIALLVVCGLFASGSERLA
jgi:hypothetical protein